MFFPQMLPSRLSRVGGGGSGAVYDDDNDSDKDNDGSATQTGRVAGQWPIHTGDKLIGPRIAK